MNQRHPALRVRITQIDYTVAQASALDNTNLLKAPVIRVYGQSSVGKTCCLHVHQVYPYFFVEYVGRLNPDSVSRYIARMTHSLNHAIAVSMKRNPHSPKSQFVRAVVLVKGVHFYGFHTSYAPFLKIHIVDPAFVQRAVTLLQAGAVMGTRFRVFESHLSYILQFLCDFGLYGCGWTDLEDAWRRGSEEDEGGDGIVSTLKPSPCFRQSRLPLEVDAIAAQILNRHVLSARNLHHQLTIPAPALTPEPLVLGVRELWDDERKRRIAAGLPPSPDIPLDPSDKSRGPGGDWVAEARYWDEIRKRIEREQGKNLKINDMSWEKWIMTTFESVEALWEDRFKTWRPGGRRVDPTQPMQPEEQNPYDTPSGSSRQSSDSAQDEDKETGVEVDESMLSSQELSVLMEQEEAEYTNLLEGNMVNEHVEAHDELLDEGPPVDEQLDADTSRPTTPQQLSNGKSPGSISTITPRKGQLETSEKAKSPLSPSTRERMPKSNSTVTPTSRYRQHPSRLLALSPQARQIMRVEHQSLSKALEAARKSESIMEQGTKRQRSDDIEDAVLRDPLINLVSAKEAVHGHAIAEDPAMDINPFVDQIPNEPLDVENGLASVLESDKSRPLKKRRLHFHDSPSAPSSPAPLSVDRVATHAQIRRVLSSQWHRKAPTIAKQTSGNVYRYAPAPPAASLLASTVDDHGIPSKIYRDPFYSKACDVPERPREYAGLMYRLKGGDSFEYLDEWVDTSAKEGSPGEMAKDHSPPTTFVRIGVGGWEYAGSPPTVRQTRAWLRSEGGRVVQKPRVRSQIEGPTQANPFGLKDTPPDPADPVVREKQDMTILSLEVFAPSRGQLLPDPDVDEIVAVFYTFQNTDIAAAASVREGIIAVDCSSFRPQRLRDHHFEIVASELDLLNAVVDMVLDLDPDFVVGWEIQAASWGYLNVRGRHFGLDIGEQISRAPGRALGAGRQVLNVWRIMRAEQGLSLYTFENSVFHLLRRRVPKYAASTLTEWFHSDTIAQVASLLCYFQSRTTMVLEVLEAAETVTKTAEFARVFGVDFYSVISRGSQFKVESFMFRIAKPESFVLLSPSKQEVGKQNAAECMPLIMEPLSAFYNSPLVVLDFQSLYPSIMIAYNYCYSTCLGRITPFKGQNKFGVTELNQPAGLLDTLQDHITVAPNGMMYVKPDVRKGLLGRMLTELLDTRVMVKQAMKGAGSNKSLKRILNARQLGLKYIANVTYGYTSASFSGRMPAVEIADSIVQSGRETLEKAIKLIETTNKWGARVVYGDTDSMFIYLRGKTKEQAFRIGHDIANTITMMNPAPVKLKFEKVYLPCVLMAKKRYVGFKFEAPDDTEPVFDAKGIETVRRDGVPAQQKMTEIALKILFRSQDLSAVKEYCWQSWSKIFDDKVSIQDFIFAREVRLGTYSDKVPPPPGAAVAARRMTVDPNDEPQYGDRVPYVIIRGEPGTRLVDRAVAPEELLEDRYVDPSLLRVHHLMPSVARRNKHLDGAYYISRVLIPPLERIFNLVGADVRSWYDEMPKRVRANQTDALLSTPSKVAKVELDSEEDPDKPSIDGHFHNSHCITCGALTSHGVCVECRMSPQQTIAGLLSHLNIHERRLTTAHESLECSWFYERKKAESKVEDTSFIHGLVEEVDAGIIPMDEAEVEVVEETEDDEDDDGELYEEYEEEVYQEQLFEREAFAEDVDAGDHDVLSL
ncbi:hypothetical protein EWM64_g4861 [Hericium alpestre]|uniref:DNA polymerase n=1 Tax=Hericium alpestre TaxID=135208 RepID=A0A4Z0A0C3_9AGAM|nr:hypothetical protein EWM64_g4861 [Hericium alpestre]